MRTRPADMMLILQNSAYKKNALICVFFSSMKSTYNLEIGQRIASLRAPTRLTQKEIASEFGIPWRTFQAYEVGAREISARALVLFYRTRGWNPTWILTGDGSPIAGNELQEHRETNIRIEDAMERLGQYLTREKRFALIEMAIERCRSGQPMDDIELENCIQMGAKTDAD